MKMQGSKHNTLPDKINRPALTQVDKIKRELVLDLLEKRKTELKKSEIAVIGVGGRYPQSETPSEFWENLKAGKSCIQEIPPDRWNAEEYFDASPDKPGKTYSKWGGFLKDIDKFDPLFFHISPAEAEGMDPQERLFLETVWGTIENAGYNLADLINLDNGERSDIDVSDCSLRQLNKLKHGVGVFVGVMNGGYGKLGAVEWRKGEDVKAHSPFWSIANRVSYFFNFQGPSIVVDTACSSSLTAIHLACESIRRGECAAAVAGGVNLIVHPTQFLELSGMKMLSRGDECRAFGAGADGFVAGEGVGAVLLKPLFKAIEDHDQIYGIIKGSHINAGGKTSGYTVPNPKAQGDLIREVLKRARVHPRTIGYIEAHGTGTSLGDPIEIAGLTRAFRKETKDAQFCALGSVKSNIGHLEAAAGIAALTKVLFQLKYKMLVPSLHARKLNPGIDFKSSPFCLQQNLSRWESPLRPDKNGKEKKYPRRAGISSFGAGGANAHLVVEEYIHQADRRPIETSEPKVFLLSAKNQERLRVYTESVIEFLCVETDSRDSAENPPALISPDQGIQDFLRKTIGELIEIPIKEIESGSEFSEYGLRIDTFSRLTSAIQERYEIELDVLEAEGFKNIQSLAEYLEGALSGREDSGPQPAYETTFGEVISITSLVDLAYTSQIGREAMDERLAVLANDKEELLEKLRKFRKGEVEIQGLYHGNIQPNDAASRLFLKGKAGKEFLRLLYQEGELETMAQLWVSGSEIDWQQLYKEELPNRVSFPGYPFARKRIWMQESREKKYVRRGMHPLIDEMRASLSGTVTFLKTFHESELIVGHHRVNNEGTMPAVGYLEMAVAAAGFLAEAKEYELGGFNWLAPLRVHDKKQVQIRLKQAENRILVDIYSEEGTQIELFARGEFTPLQNGSRDSAEKVSVDEIIGKCQEWISHDELYDDFFERGVEYREFYRGLRQIWVNGKEAIGEASIPEQFIHESTDYVLPPTLMDAALQTIAGVSTEKKILRLPFSVGRVEVRRKIPQRVFTYVRVTGDLCYDIALLAPDGSVCVRLYDIHLRIPRQTHNGMFYKPTWVSQSLAKAPDLLPEAPREVLIVTSEANRKLANALRAGYQSANVNELILGEQNRKRPDSQKEINPEGSRIYEYNSELPAKVNLIYFLAEPGRTLVQTLNNPDQNRTSDFFNFFRLIKKLIDIGLTEREIRIKILTDQVYSLDGEQTRTGGACLSGFAKGLVREYPNWKVQCIDLNFAETLLDSGDDQILKFPDLVLRENKMNEAQEVLVRGGQRFVREFIKTEVPDAQNKLLRMNGIYLILGGAGGIGFEFSKYLAKEFKARLVWIGRRKSDERIRIQINEISGLGGQVQYFQAAAESLSEMTQVVENVKSEYGRIHGVVHSAISLNDMTIADMDVSDLEDALKPKVMGSAVLGRLFRHEPLDFMLFFSSAISFRGNAGQSSYGAASGYQDAFAAGLNFLTSYPVRIINWGYWGSVGVVATERYREQLRNRGIHSIEPPEGIRAILQALNGDMGQLMAIKAEKSALSNLNIRDEHVMRIAKEKTANVSYESSLQNLDFPFDMDSIRNLKQGLTALEAFCGRLLAGVMRKFGAFKDDGEQFRIEALYEKLGIKPEYNRLFQAMIDILERNDFLVRENQRIFLTKNLGSIPANLEEMEAEKDSIIKRCPQIAAYTELVWICLNAYDRVLTGAVGHMEVMFPDGSMKLVENLYKGNKIADYCNRFVAEAVKTFAENSIRENPSNPVRILEIGAGTGGTSEITLRLLREVSGPVEFYYTDISDDFLEFGKNKFGEFTFAKFQKLDIEKSLKSQGFPESRFDVIFATNVIHATKNIRDVLCRAKKLLKTDGSLFINEVTGLQDFLTLTFGLTSGWWLYEEKEIRIPNSPLLTPTAWRAMLISEGFKQVRVQTLPESTELESEQCVISAMSDGLLKKKANSGKKIRKLMPMKIGTAAKETERVPAGGELLPQIRKYVKDVFAEVLKMSIDDFEPNETFEKYGIDSLKGVKILSHFEKKLNRLPPTLLFENVTIEKLSRYFLDNHEEQFMAMLAPNMSIYESIDVSEQLKPSAPIIRRTKNERLQSDSNYRTSSRMDIAVIGVQGRYPSSDTLEEFWENLKNGRHCISEIPEERWDWRRYYDPEGEKKYKSYSKWGGFISDVDKFDPLFFNISPRDARLMDPQERLFLQNTWNLLEDAGYPYRKLSEHSERVGVFVGVMYGTYGIMDAGNWTEEKVNGLRTSYWSIPNRVSYFFDLHGPSMAIDSACSSSLTAIHLACESIKRRECRAAIAGGVNLILHPAHMINLSGLKMLSSKNASGAFGSGADGFICGEGLGSVLLKPLDDAVADNDNILAVIKGSFVNAGGKTSGYTVPNPNAQADVIKEALERSGVHPRTVSYLEAHGTGTALGDPIEIAGLNKAFMKKTDVKQFCAIGSVKSNIGHLEAAAGISCVTKVLLQLKHKSLAPSLHVEALNPKIDFNESPFYVQRELASWKKPLVKIDDEEKIYPRRAGISSFGAGGANVHLIMEEFESPERTPASDTGPQIIPLSARDEERLLESVNNLLQFLETNPDVVLSEIAYTLQVDRAPMECRLAVISRSISDLKRILTKLANEKTDSEHVYRGKLKSGAAEPQDIGELKFLSQEEKSEDLLRRVAELWIRGGTIDWEVLRGGDEIRRIKLPNYPFAKQRYWLKKAESKTGRPTSGIMVDEMLPGLSLGKGLVFRKEIALENPIINDHRISGRPVLPVAGYISALVSAVKMTFGVSRPRIFNMLWLRPFLPGGKRTEIYFSLTKEGNELKFTATSGENRENLHSSATVKIDSVEEPEPSLLLSVNDIRMNCPENIDSNEFYARLSEIGIGYSGYYRGINEIHKNENEALASYTFVPKFPNELEENPAHPAIIDLSLQLMAVLAGDFKGSRKELYTSFSVGQVQLLHAVGKEGHVYVQRISEKEFNVAILDESENVCVKLQNVTLRKMRNDSSHNLVFQPIWKEEPLSESVSDKSGEKKNVLLVYSKDAMDLSCSIEEAHSGDELFSVRLGESTQNISENRWSVNTDAPDAFHDIIRSIKPLDRIYFMGGVQCPSGDSDAPNEPEKAQKEGVMTLLHLTQALKLLKKYRPGVTLKIITNDVWSLSEKEINRNAYSGSILGFFRSLRNEFLSMKVNYVDFSWSEFVARSSRSSLVRSIIEENTESAVKVLLRAGLRYVEALVPAPWTSNGMEPFRKNGTYVIVGGAGGIGLELSQYLAENFKARLVLIGRSDLNETQRRKIKGIVSTGARVLYIQADITDFESMRGALMQIKDQFNEIHGVFHSAVVLSDQRLEQMDDATFHKVLSPKVQGSEILYRVFRDEIKDFLVFFSSVQSYGGKSGKSNYAAGCTFKDAYGSYLNKISSFTVKVLNLGFWKKSVEESDTDTEKRYEALGIYPIKKEEGMQAISRTLMQPDSNYLILKAKDSTLRKIGLEAR